MRLAALNLQPHNKTSPHICRAQLQWEAKGLNTGSVLTLVTVSVAVTAAILVAVTAMVAPNSSATALEEYIYDATRQIGSAGGHS